MSSGFQVTELLRLRVEETDDLAPVSALTQDMTVKVDDICCDKRGRRLVLMGNRFRHEAPDMPSRTRCLLRIDFIDSVQRRKWPVNPEAVLALLAIRHELVEGREVLELRFTDGACLRGTIEVLDITLEDLAGPWGARTVPCHD